MVLVFIVDMVAIVTMDVALGVVQVVDFAQALVVILIDTIRDEQKQVKNCRDRAYGYKLKNTIRLF